MDSDQLASERPADLNQHRIYSVHHGKDLTSFFNKI